MYVRYNIVISKRLLHSRGKDSFVASVCSRFMRRSTWPMEMNSRSSRDLSETSEDPLIYFIFTGTGVGLVLWREEPDKALFRQGRGGLYRPCGLEDTHFH